MSHAVRAVRQRGSLAVGLPVAAVVAAVSCAAGAAGAYKWQAYRWAAADAERIQAEQELTRAQNTALTRSAERIDRETTDKLRAAERAAAGARNDLERLRLAANQVQPVDPSASSSDDGGRLSRVLGLLAKGAELVEEGGRRVDRLAAEKAGLQRANAEIRGVLVGP